MLELIVNVDEPGQESATVRLGLAIAHAQQAFVTGLHIVATFPSIMALPEAWAALGREEQSARAHGEWWTERCRRAGVPGEWEVVRGLYVPAMARRSRMADLVISTSPTGTADLPLGFDQTTRALFAGASPMLLVPAAWEGGAPERVLVAWNDSAEATDAVRAALPLLRRAATVHVLEGEREPGVEGLQSPPLRLLPWLARQGVNVQRRQIFDTGAPVGETLLAEAEAMHADLLVMGAWGRSRFSELVLGGITHHLLQHARLPLLLAH